jgi:hypothetical protein
MVKPAASCVGGIAKCDGPRVWKAGELVPKAETIQAVPVRHQVPSLCLPVTHLVLTSTDSSSPCGVAASIISRLVFHLVEQR